MIHPETIRHNDEYLQRWCFDSNDFNSRMFFALSQEAEGKIHVYNIDISNEILIRNLKSVLEALEKQK